MRQVTRDQSIRTSGVPLGRLLAFVCGWLFMMAMTWLGFNLGWNEIDPDLSTRHVIRWRVVTVAMIPVLVGSGRAIGVAAGLLPYLWVRHVADGSVVVRNVAGLFGSTRGTVRAAGPEHLVVWVEQGTRPTNGTIPSWISHVSNGVRLLSVLTRGEVDQEVLQAKVSGKHQAPVREPY